MVRQGALARTRPDARRAVALSSVRARHLGPQTHLGGVPRAGQVDPAGRADQDEGGSPGAVVDARDAAAGRGAGVLRRAAASVRYTKKQVKVASVASVRPFVRSAGIPIMHHCFDLSCVSLAIVSIALMIPDFYVPAWTTSPSHIEFHDNVYRMHPR